MVYLDNSATTRVDPQVAQRAVEVMCKTFGNPSSLHGVGSAAYTELGVARNQIAKMLAAKTSCIYFTSGGTASNNIAIQGGALANVAVGKHLVTTMIEHDSILHSCRHMEELGWEVSYVRPDPKMHLLRAEDVIQAVRPDTALVSVMFVNNETGEILPIKEIVEGVRKKNPQTRIHCDCVQGFGKLPFKLHEYDVDMASMSGHKIHAPKGIGALYLRDPSLVKPLKFGGSQEGKINPGTESFPLACAFGLASDLALYRIKEQAEETAKLRQHFIERLQSAFPDMLINSPEKSSPYVLSVSLPGASSHDLVSKLSGQGVYVSAGSACSKGSRSHVLEAMGLEPERIDSVLRISFGTENRKEDADVLVEAIKASL